MTAIELAQKKLDEHRLNFPALANKRYFNYGAQGTASRQCLEAIQKSYEFVQENGPLSDKMFGWIENEVKETRLALSKEFGGEPGAYAITQNTTEGCNIVMWGKDWQAGDHILLTDCEHPGVVAAAEQLASRFKLNLTYVPIASLTDDNSVTNSIAAAITDRTKLLVVSHVFWNTGRVLPLEEVTAACHARGVQVLVDGAQSAGVLPLDLGASAADFYAFTGHKWICGPEGVGTLYIRPESLESIAPTFVGWRGITFGPKGEISGFRKDSSRFEVSTAPFPLLAGLRAAIALHNQHGSISTRHKLLCEHVNRLRERLTELSSITLMQSGASGLVPFNLLEQSPRTLVDALDSSQIIVRTIPQPYCVRASIHYLSTESEIDELVAGITKFVEKK